ncbi:hypothetical protein [Natrialba hulunbeirensis]|uniref:hypothetical protein n=1 Tax=Natrialba hulunbeirensis TaxID=123783 RepID=UPI000A007186|nr:hypothetical protein [Natrialba hulunbeirensis]
MNTHSDSSRAAVTKLSIWCIIATVLLAFYVLSDPLIFVFTLGLGVVALIGGRIVYSVPADRRIKVATVTVLSVLTAGALVPLVVQHVADYWELGRELMVSITAIGIAAILGISLETLRRLLPENNIA